GDGQSRDVGRVRQPGVGGAPPPAAISAHKYATAVRTIERGRRLRVDGQGIHVQVAEAGVDGTPAPPAIGALEYAATCARIMGGWRLRVDGQRQHIAIADCGAAAASMFADN